MCTYRVDYLPEYTHLMSLGCGKDISYAGDQVQYVGKGSTQVCNILR